MKCLKCGGVATLRGRVGRREVWTHFVPAGLKWFTFNTHHSVLLGESFHACTQCGHAWSECDAADLRNLIDAAATKELLADLRQRATSATGQARAVHLGITGACPACLDPVSVAGRVRAQDARKFFPEGVQSLFWPRSVDLDHLQGEALLRACTGCGHVWGALHPGTLCRLVEDHGGDAMRLRLRNLGMPNP
jgi:hypothetical protein